MSQPEAYATAFSMFCYLLPIFFAVGLATPAYDGRAQRAQQRNPKRRKSRVASVAKTKQAKQPKVKKRKPQQLSAQDQDRLDRYRIGRDLGDGFKYSRMPL